MWCSNFVPYELTNIYTYIASVKREPGYLYLAGVYQKVT